MRDLFVTLDRQFRSLRPMGKLLAIVLLGTFIVRGSTKTNNSSSATSQLPDLLPEDGGQSLLVDGGGQSLLESEGAPSGPRLSTNQYLAGFALVRVATNVAAWRPMPANAVVHAPWMRYGVAEDTFWLPATNWSFTLGTNTVEGLHVSSSGTLSFGSPKGSPRARAMPDGSELDFLAPLQTSIGTAPPAGRFWHAPTPSNSLLLTWQDVYANRDTNYPVSLQSELFRNGDFTFRYAFTNAPALTNFVIGAQHNGGGETCALSETNRLVNGLELRWRAFGMLDPGIDDHDGDGLSTYDEVMVHGTDPRSVDSDGDGIDDGVEVAAHSDALDPDEDGDGIPDGIDLTGYDPDDPDLVFRLANGIAPDVDLTLDTDADGWADWLEERFGTDPGAAWDTPEGLDTLFLATVTLGAPPAERGVLSVGGRRVLVEGAASWLFWLPAGEEHPVSFTSLHDVPPPFTFVFNRPSAARTGMPEPDGAGGDFGEVMLPLMVVEPTSPRCCHYDREPCETYTAYIMPPMAGTYTWLVNDIPGYGVGNRLDAGHDISSIRARFTPANGLACVEKTVQPNAHCPGFYENMHSGVCSANLIFANTDDDDGDQETDNNDFYVENEDEIVGVTPLTLSYCCPCEVHAETNWTCRLGALTDNLRVYSDTNKVSRLGTGDPVMPGQAVYVEGLISSTNRYADWLEWEYDGLVEPPGGTPVATNFAVRALYTVIDLLAAPVRLEPISTVTNAQGLIVNPAGVAEDGLALYRVSVVPQGIIPDDDITWSIASGNVSFYAGHRYGRDAIIRGGSTAGAFSLEVSVNGFPETYRPYIHGEVLEPTTTPIYVYIICDSNGVPAVSTATVNAWVAEANRIYRQAAMSFATASISYVTNQFWVEIESDTEFDEMCSHASGTGGLEIYCVNLITWAAGVHSDPRLAYGDPRRGLAVSASSCHVNTLAHEIGHACGLGHVNGDGFDAEVVSEELTGTPNWSGGDGSGYHTPDLRYRQVAARVIMSTEGGAARSDVPLDGVMGKVDGVEFTGIP